MSPARCASPIEFASLVDYWLGELSSIEQEPIEEHLFACAECTERTEDLARLAEAVRRNVRAGTVRAIVTEAFLERVEREGLRVREYRLEPGGSVACSVAPEDDVLIARVTADFRGTKRVDLFWLDENTGVETRIEDLPVRESMRELIWIQRIDETRRLPATTQRARLVAVDESGERILGEYTFNHSPHPGT